MKKKEKQSYKIKRALIHIQTAKKKRACNKHTRKYAYLSSIKKKYYKGETQL